MEVRFNCQIVLLLLICSDLHQIDVLVAEVRRLILSNF